MDNKLFTKKSLDKIKSPESLNDYIRVSNPGIWILLVAVAVLLIGACVWGVFGRLDTKVNTSGVFENNEAIVFVSNTDIEENMPVEVDGVNGSISGVEYVTKDEETVACVTIKAEVPNGKHSVNITTETVKPLSFLLN